MWSQKEKRQNSYELNDDETEQEIINEMQQLKRNENTLSPDLTYPCNMEEEIFSE